MVYVYILRSESSGRYYCGQTNDLDRRIRQHNDPSHQTTKTTKRFIGPWILVWSCSRDNRSDAMALEKQIKKRGIARFLAEQTT